MVGTVDISSTVSGITGEYDEALSDTAVDFTDQDWSTAGLDIGAWCVTDESKTTGTGQ